MKTREQAIQDASDVLAGILATVSTLTPRQAAERAWHPGGPSIEILTAQIAATGICANTAKAAA